MRVARINAEKMKIFATTSLKDGDLLSPQDIFELGTLRKAYDCLELLIYPKNFAINEFCRKFAIN